MEKRLSEEQRQSIKGIQANLLRIKMTGTAPVNITQYQNRLGLVQSQVSRDYRGNILSSRLNLTEKGRRVLGTRNI